MSKVDEEPRALLAIWVRVPPEVKADYDQWHDQEHLPERRVIEGFLNATRFVPIDGGEEHMALYELTSSDVLDSDAYLALKRKEDTDLGRRVRAGWQDHERALYRLRTAISTTGEHPVHTPYIYSVRARYRPEVQSEVAQWLDEEHAERLLDLEGVTAYQGWEPVTGPAHFFNLWGLQDPGLPASDQWAAAIESPRRSVLVDERLDTVRRVYARWPEP